MKTLIPFGMAMTLLGSAAFAQTTTTTPSTPASPPVVTTTPTVTPAPGATTGTDMVMTDQHAQQWVNKAVYSSDGKNLGEVAAVQRDSTGKVTEIHADIGGFLGIGETRVRVMPNQFQLSGDRVVLSMSSEQAKALPAIQK